MATKKNMFLSLLLVVAVSAIVLFHFSGRQQQHRQLYSNLDPKTVHLKHNSWLLFITFSYDALKGNEQNDKKREKYQPFILNNCLLVKEAGHIMHIYTDDMDQEYCRYCDCIQYEAYNCECPGYNCTERRNICEKNYLYADLLAKEDEFVFLDFDLAIVKPEKFFPELYARSRVADFLATRAHGVYKSPTSMKYKEDFNSGLVFIRALTGVDPYKLREMLYEGKGNVYDQHVLSQFVHQYYDDARWDELSIKWHCRLIGEIFKDMPLEDCYTIHSPGLLRELNYTLVKPKVEVLVPS